VASLALCAGFMDTTGDGAAASAPSGSAQGVSGGAVDLPNAVGVPHGVADVAPADGVADPSRRRVRVGGAALSRSGSSSSSGSSSGSSGRRRRAHDRGSPVPAAVAVDATVVAATTAPASAGSSVVVASGAAAWDVASPSARASSPLRAGHSPVGTTPEDVEIGPPLPLEDDILTMHEPVGAEVSLDAGVAVAPAASASAQQVPAHAVPSSTSAPSLAKQPAGGRDATKSECSASVVHHVPPLLQDRRWRGDDDGFDALHRCLCVQSAQDAPWRAA
jgi:hypothetical protein